MHCTPTSRYLATLEKHIEALHAARVAAESAPWRAAEPGVQPSLGCSRARAAEGSAAGQRRRRAAAQGSEGSEGAAG